MKKAVKIVFKTILWIVVALVAAVLALPLWIGPVAKSAANGSVPKMTGTAFRLGDFGFNFYTGKLRVGDVTLYNPEGYKPEEAFKLGSLNVELEVLSTLSDTIVVNDITIRDVFVSYVSKDGVNNFDAILENVQKATAGEPKEETEPVKEAEAPAAKEEKPKKKVIIDHLLIDGVTVQWGPLPIKLPTKIELTGIGRKSNGVDWSEAATEISDAIMKQLNSLGQGLMDFGGALKDMGLDGANQVLDAVKDLDVKGATDAVGNAAGAAMGAAGSALGSAKDGAGAAFGSVTKTLGSATEGAGDAVGSTAASVGKAAGSVATGAGKAIGSAADGAGKALGATTDAVKSGAGAAMDVTTDALKGAGNAVKGLFGK